MQHVDAVAEGEQRPIDVRTFYHAQSTVSSFGGSLTAGQAYQRQLSDLDFRLYSRIFVLVLAYDLQNSVRP